MKNQIEQLGDKFTRIILKAKSNNALDAVKVQFIDELTDINPETEIDRDLACDLQNAIYELIETKRKFLKS